VPESARDEFFARLRSALKRQLAPAEAGKAEKLAEIERRRY
jgi:hypothetical protein